MATKIKSVDIEKDPVEASQYLVDMSPDEFDSEENAEEVITQLRDAIAYHDQRYYVMNDPVISDSEYDRLYHLLEEIEDKFPDLVTPTSPTQRIGEKVSGEFPEVEHLTPMLSLDNSYNLEDLEDFDDRVKKLTGKSKITYSVEPKLDGTGISLIYEDDKFVRGATRGDGSRGEDITHNLRVLRSIPLKAKFSEYGIYKAEIRGEVLIQKKEFKELNKEREKKGESLFANPRNAAAGSLRMQDPEKVAQRNLTAWIYQVSHAEDEEGKQNLEDEVKTQDQAIKILHKSGFKTPAEQLQTTRSVKELLDICREWEQKREDFPFEIDGLVIKVNDMLLYEDLGVTSHHPRWAIAFKFKARQATTRLTSVDFQVGRTGAITPVAKLESVEVGGVTITSASLHNEDYIKDKDIKLNDTVLVERAGDVIPYIVKPIKEKRHGNTKDITIPKKCPSCGSKLSRPEGEAVWRCLNLGCTAQIKRRIIHFVSKGAMDVDGLGGKMVDRFYREGLLQSLPDIYQLDYDEIRKLEGFGKKSVSNLEQAVEASKDRPLYRLINALSIPLVGSNTARTLADEVECVTDLKSMSEVELMELEDIGETVAQSIHDFFDRKENVKTIEELEKTGVKVCKSKKEQNKNDKLEDLTFVFTGGLDSYTREEVKDLVERLGGHAVGSVSSNVDFVVRGENPGSKLDEAEERGIKIIEEKEFMKMID